ncbi:MAG: hypothetical protein EA353_11120 [Puniceicoccaceae bacterium]|nr:MAG: hypothetical protein EA353_11120 [Puniceicoccaceae bacterium]
MKIHKIDHLFRLFCLILAGSILDARDINLGGSRDLVLRQEVRGEVMDLAQRLLSVKESDYPEQIVELKTPFSFEEEKTALAEVEEAEPEAAIVYDEASVLRLAAESFSKQVRGTLVRGETSLLQLSGGSLIRPGTSFPVTIPQAQGQSFVITISEITGNSYTLKLGESEQVVRLTGTASEGSGAVFSN